MLLPIGPHSEDIKAAIRKKGENLYSLARKNRLSKHAISVSFIKPIPRAHRAVAAFLDLPVQHLWPKWYDDNGKRIRSHSNYKRSPKREASHSKKAPAGLTRHKAGA